MIDYGGLQFPISAIAVAGGLMTPEEAVAQVKAWLQSEESRELLPEEAEDTGQ